MNTRLHRYTSICGYHLGLKSKEERDALDAAGHTFVKDYDLYFYNCTNRRCTRSHNRKEAIELFYNHPEIWFDYVRDSTGKGRIPRRYIYQPFQAIRTSITSLRNEIEKYTKPPCYSIVDGDVCKDAHCEREHDPRRIHMYFVYHPDEYFAMLTHKISRGFMGVSLEVGTERAERERKGYYEMLAEFKHYGIRPLGIDSAMVYMQKPSLEGILNKVTSATMAGYVESVHNYIVSLPDASDFCREMCNLVVSEAAKYQRFINLYQSFVSLVMNSEGMGAYESVFVSELCAAITREFNARFSKLSGFPVGYEFPDENLLQKEIRNVLQFESLFNNVPQLKEDFERRIDSIVSNANVSANMIVIPYIIDMSHCPRKKYRALYEQVMKLEPSSFVSKLKFKLMDLLGM